jgi:multiple sugar transport system permease protein
MTLLGIFFLFPMLFMIMSSFKPDDQIFADLTGLKAFLPVGDISLDNYSGVFDRVPAARFLANSIFVTAMIVGIGLVVNSMAGFALSRMEWRGRKIVFALVIATLILPFETIALPMVFWVSKLPWLGFDGGPHLEQGWLNSYHVQILPFAANAFSIFLFAQYFSSIPKSLDEAARIDGANWFMIYRRVICPLSGPVFATGGDPDVPAGLELLPVAADGGAGGEQAPGDDRHPVLPAAPRPAWGEIMAYSTLITIRC